MGLPREFKQAVRWSRLPMDLTNLSSCGNMHHKNKNKMMALAVPRRHMAGDVDPEVPQRRVADQSVA